MARSAGRTIFDFVVWRRTRDSRPIFDVYAGDYGGERLAGGQHVTLEPNDSVALLHSDDFTLSSKRDGIEFRVLVDANDEMALDAIRLTTLSCNRK